MQFKKEETVLKEITDLTVSRINAKQRELYGQFQFYCLSRAERERLHSPIFWVLNAQSGTLRKIQSAFPDEHKMGSLELLAIVRNLFENLVWLRLFNLDQQFGLVFYARFLAQQVDNQSAIISKIEQEASLFLELEQADSANLNTAFQEIIKGDTSDEAARLATESHVNLTAELDDRARREFALYASAAEFNGYGYQAHLLNTVDLPKQRALLDKILSHQANFEAVRQSLVTGRFVRMTEAHARWNWKERAAEVGMVQQYDFIYGYTSRLLHSTPMNLVTETQLSQSERIMMLEYCYITVHDLLDEIERFSFPGKVMVISVEKANDTI